MNTMNSKITMKTFSSLVLALSLLISSVGVSRAADGPGTTTGELLKIPVGARQVGMGEAATAGVNDSSSLEWNPAGLSFAEHKEVSFMHSSLIEGVHYEHLAFASPGDNYSYGFSTSYLGYGDIAGYSNTGAATGNLSAYSTILSGGISTIVLNHLSLGFTGSAIQEKLASDSAWTVAANLGSIYNFAQHPLEADYKVGFSILNVGPGLKFVSERAPLPRKFKFGGSIDNIKGRHVNLTMDITKPNDNSTYVSIGSEYWLKQIIALRLGYDGSNDVGKGLRLGIGLKLRQLLFDYAYGGFGDFGATHRIQVGMQWGERVKQLNLEQRRILKDAKRLGAEGDPTAEIAKLNELLEQDPTNTRVLKQMIAANDTMLKNELREAVASAPSEELPNPEQMVLKELVPGQEQFANNTTGATIDPLGLENLPDVNNLVPSQMNSPLASAPAPVLKESESPRASQPAAADEQQPSRTTSSDSGVMVNPADIYGN
jgi:hypothetical protein